MRRRLHQAAALRVRRKRRCRSPTTIGSIAPRSRQPASTRRRSPAIVGRADMLARVDGLSVRGTLQLDGEVFQRGAVKVALFGGTTLIQGAHRRIAAPLLHEATVTPRSSPGRRRSRSRSTGPPRCRPHPAVPGSPCRSRRPVRSARSSTCPAIRPTSASSRASSSAAPPRTAAPASSSRSSPDEPRSSPGRCGRRRSRPRSRTRACWRTSARSSPSARRSCHGVADRSLGRAGRAAIAAGAAAGGDELAAVTGGSIDGYDVRGTLVTLQLRDPASRGIRPCSASNRHTARDPSRPTPRFNARVLGVQREAGEAAIEGIGAVDVNASGDDQLRRMDVRETHASLHRRRGAAARRLQVSAPAELRRGS